jgi:hypothetical protein
LIWVPLLVIVQWNPFVGLDILQPIDIFLVVKKDILMVVVDNTGFEVDENKLIGFV